MDTESAWRELQGKFAFQDIVDHRQSASQRTSSRGRTTPRSFDGKYSMNAQRATRSCGSVEGKYCA